MTRYPRVPTDGYQQANNPLDPASNSFFQAKVYSFYDMLYCSMSSANRFAS